MLAWEEGVGVGRGEAGLLNGICIHSEINWFKTNDANRKARQP